MSTNITIINNEGYPIPEALLKEAAQTVLRQQKAPHNSELSIVLMSDAAVRALNQQFRGIDAPTDVLSFPAEALPPEMMGETAYLGDLIIAYPYAQAQAQQAQHPLADSLALLVIHGVLHLLGYDHHTSEERARMWSAQAKALNALAISDTIVPSLESYYGDHEKS